MYFVLMVLNIYVLDIIGWFRVKIQNNCITEFRVRIL